MERMPNKRLGQSIVVQNVLSNRREKNKGEFMSLENPCCQEEEDYIRQNYSEQASWCCGQTEEENESAEE